MYIVMRVVWVYRLWTAYSSFSGFFLLLNFNIPRMCAYAIRQMIGHTTSITPYHYTRDYFISIIHQTQEYKCQWYELRLNVFSQNFVIHSYRPTQPYNIFGSCLNVRADNRNEQTHWKWEMIILILFFF